MIVMSLHRLCTRLTLFVQFRDKQLRSELVFVIFVVLFSHVYIANSCAAPIALLLLLMISFSVT